MPLCPRHKTVKSVICSFGRLTQNGVSLIVEHANQVAPARSSTCQEVGVKCVGDLMSRNLSYRAVGQWPGGRFVIACRLKTRVRLQVCDYLYSYMFVPT